MKKLLLATLCLLAMDLAPAHGDEPRAHVLVVVGAEGSSEYGEQFRAWAERWRLAAEQAKAAHVVIGLDANHAQSDCEQLQARLAEPSSAPLWLVLIGHGTFDGKTARFNLRGPDITPADLNAWLKDVPRPVAIINCASASGPFLSELSTRGRVVVTAAKSGHEVNFARFGDYLSAAITDRAADLDKDEQTSLLEAYLVASAKTREFYSTNGRLATEHALLDDNGDRLGTPAEWFQGLRAAKSAKQGAALDGGLARTFILATSAREEQLCAAQRERRDQLEAQIAALRDKKATLPADEYYQQLEPLLVEFAGLYVGEPKKPAAATPAPAE